LLQKNASPGQILELIESGRLERLLPDGGRRFMPALIASAAVILALAAAVVIVLRYTDLFSPDRAVREPAVDMISLDDVGNIIDLSGEYRYVLTEKEIEQSFSDVKKHFSRFRDNLAQREINRLLGSNASISVKEQARVIASYIPVPDFTTVSDQFDYEAVTADPFLYKDTFVVWSGKISNLAVGDDRITFDLLVGYENNQILLGIVAVRLEFAVSLNDGNAVEVLGRLNLTEDEEFFLDAVSIHKKVQKVDG
jgi:hypothetical protein